MNVIVRLLTRIAFALERIAEAQDRQAASWEESNIRAAKLAAQTDDMHHVVMSDAADRGFVAPNFLPPEPEEDS